MHALSHCSADQLTDLAPLFDTIRTWPGIHEPKPGVFYLKQDLFIQCLFNATHRWAQARRGITWGTPVILPSEMADFDRQRILRELKDRYQRTSFALSRSLLA